MSAAKEGLRIAGVVLDGVDILHRIVNVGGKPADELLAAVRSALRTMRDGMDGATSPQVVLSHLEALRDGIAIDNAAADSELDRKFKTP